jgi:chaperonin cofactor prefoldin
MNDTSKPIPPKHLELLSKLEQILNNMNMRVTVLERQVNKLTTRNEQLRNELARVKVTHTGKR